MSKLWFDRKDAAYRRRHKHSRVCASFAWWRGLMRLRRSGMWRG